jgi:hypothetical protein
LKLAVGSLSALIASGRATDWPGGIRTHWRSPTFTALKFDERNLSASSFTFQRNEYVEHPLCKDGGKNLAADIGEAKTPAVVHVSKERVIDSDNVQDGGVQIVYIDSIDDGSKTDFIGLTEADAALHAATSQPKRAGMGIVISSWLGACLGNWQSAELAAPNH